MNLEYYLKKIGRRYFSIQVAEKIGALIDEIKTAHIHKQGIKGIQKYYDKKGLKINFGSGPYPKKDFLNLDFSDKADVRLDLRQSVPLPDACASLIFSEHFLEHLTYPEGAESFVKDCYRILEPNGIFSVSVPGTDWIYLEIPDKGAALNKMAEENKWHPAECVTFLEHVNYHFRQRSRGNKEHEFGLHRFAYDFETMKKLLESCGFKNIQLRDPDPNIDSPHRIVGSLFVQAVK